MDRLRSLGVVIVYAVVILGPFYQGLFFPLPSYVAVAVLAIAFGVWAYGRYRLGHALDLTGEWTRRFLLVLIGAYLLQFGWAVYPRGNLDWVLRALAGYFVFAILSHENCEIVRRRLAQVVVVSTGVVALLGVLECAGFFSQYPAIGNFFQIAANEGRLGSVYQYPNAAAIAMLVAWTVGLGLLIEERELWKRSALAALMAVLSVGMLLTLSRGALVVLPLTVALACVGVRRDAVGSLLANALCTLVLPLALVFRPLTVHSVAGNWPAAIGLVIFAAAVAGGALLLAERLSASSRRVKALGLALILGSASAIAVVGVKTGALQVPSIVNRLLDINLRTNTVQSRFEMVGDAMHAFAAQPWGYGGLGWERIYGRYQTANYISRLPHNHYVQTLLEAGPIGLLALFGAILTGMWVGFKNRDGSALSWTMVAAAGGLAIHSLLDFDLSYMSLWILLWGFLAAGQPPADVGLGKRRTERRRQGPGVAILAVSVAALIFVLSVDLAAAAVLFRQAETAVALSDNDTALAKTNKAIAFDPWNSTYLGIVASVPYLERAVAVDPYNASLWQDLALLRAETGDLTGAFEAAERTLSLQPMRRDRYELAVTLGAKIMDDAIAAGNTEEVRRMSQELSKIGYLLEQQRSISEPYRHLHPSYEQLDWTPGLALGIGKAAVLSGDEQVAEQLLLRASEDPTAAGEARLWLEGLSAKRGQTLEATPPDAVEDPVFNFIWQWR